MSTLLITIVPSILILSFFVLSDKFKEPKLTILTVFFLGFLICLPAGILNTFSDTLINDGELSKRLAHSFLGPAWAEELLKFLILYLIVVRRNEFNEPMDGIVYGVVVSLGFATYENYDYVFRLAETWDINPMDMAIWRSYSAVPMHGFYNFFTYPYHFSVLLILLIYSIILHGDLRKLQKTKKKEDEIKKI